MALVGACTHLRAWRAAGDACLAIAVAAVAVVSHAVAVSWIEAVELYERRVKDHAAAHVARAVRQVIVPAHSARQTGSEESARMQW